VTTFYNKVLNDEERARLVSNIAGHLKDAKDFIQKRAVSAFLLYLVILLLLYRTKHTGMYGHVGGTWLSW
jgi:hypothetical protein